MASIALVIQVHLHTLDHPFWHCGPPEHPGWISGSCILSDFRLKFNNWLPTWHFRFALVISRVRLKSTRNFAPPTEARSTVWQSPDSNESRFLIFHTKDNTLRKKSWFGRNERFSKKRGKHKSVGNFVKMVQMCEMNFLTGTHRFLVVVSCFFWKFGNVIVAWFKFNRLKQTFWRLFDGGGQKMLSKGKHLIINVCFIAYVI